jgi:hypothetical protein
LNDSKEKAEETTEKRIMKRQKIETALALKDIYLWKEQSFLYMWLFKNSNKP